MSDLWRPRPHGRLYITRYTPVPWATVHRRWISRTMCPGLLVVYIPEPRNHDLCIKFRGHTTRR